MSNTFIKLASTPGGQSLLRIMNKTTAGGVGKAKEFAELFPVNRPTSGSYTNQFSGNFNNKFPSGVPFYQKSRGYSKRPPLTPTTSATRTAQGVPTETATSRNLALGHTLRSNSTPARPPQKVAINSSATKSSVNAERVPTPSGNTSRSYPDIGSVRPRDVGTVPDHVAKAFANKSKPSLMQRVKNKFNTMFPGKVAPPATMPPIQPVTPRVVAPASAKPVNSVPLQQAAETKQVEEAKPTMGWKKPVAVAAGVGGLAALYNNNRDNQGPQSYSR